MHRTGHPAVRLPRTRLSGPGLSNTHETEHPMARKHSNRLPKLGRHSSGQARVTLNGKVYYCGPWGSLDAQKRYAELIEKWEANGRQPLDPVATAPQVRRVRDVLDEFMAWLDATGRYQKHGKAT